MSLFNFGQTTPAQPVQQSSGFNFSLGQPAATQPLTTQPAATQPAASQSLFETPFGQTTFQQPASSIQNQSLPLTSAPQPVATVSVGLGGEGASSQAAAVDSKLPKDSQILPPEISSIVDSLKSFTAAQKSLCDKNSLPKYSVQPILDISSELDEHFKTALQRLDVTVERNKTAVESLKKETNVMVSDGENALRCIKSLGISSSSSSYPFSSSYPSYPFVQSPASPARTSAYFDRLVDHFEQQMDLYSRQMKELEAHVANMNTPHSPHEVILIVKKQHETLVALASQIYALHEHVSSLDTRRSTAPSSLRSTAPSGQDTRRSTAPSSSLDTRRSTAPGPESFLKGTKPKSFVGPNPFALTSSSTPPVSAAHNHPEHPASGSVPGSGSSASSLLPLNPSFSNFSFSSPSNTSSPNRAKRFTAS